MLAWQIERLNIMAMQKDGGRKLPDVRKMLKDMRDANADSGKQTPTEQLAVIHALNVASGVPMQRLRKGPDGKYRSLAK